MANVQDFHRETIWGGFLMKYYFILTGSDIAPEDCIFDGPPVLTTKGYSGPFSITVIGTTITAVSVTCPSGAVIGGSSMFVSFRVKLLGFTMYNKTVVLTVYPCDCAGGVTVTPGWVPSAENSGLNVEFLDKFYSSPPNVPSIPGGDLLPKPSR